MASGSLVNSAIRFHKPHTVPVGGRVLMDYGKLLVMIDTDVGHDLFALVVDMVQSSGSHGEAPTNHEQGMGNKERTG